MKARVLAGAGLLAFAATLAVAANALLGPAHDGPLSTSSQVHVVAPPLAEGDVFSWGAYLPGNPTTTDIQIESIEPVGVRSLQILAVVLGYPVLQPDGTCLAHGAGTSPGFPPPGMATSEVKGRTLPPENTLTCGKQPYATVAVRLLRDGAGGSIEALRLLYRQNGTLYELVLPYSLAVPRRGPSTN